MNAIKKSIKGCCTFEDILDVQYGPEGTTERDQFERDAEAFILAERFYISRIENGKADVQLSTLFKIFQGLGKRVSLTIL